jgi:hypothetical protein
LTTHGWIDCGGEGVTDEQKLVAARVNHDWIHAAIRERFVVRDTTELDVASQLDYLSMRCSVGLRDVLKLTMISF